MFYITITDTMLPEVRTCHHHPKDRSQYNTRCEHTSPNQKGKLANHKAPTEIEWDKIKNYIEVFSCDGSKFNTKNWKKASVVFMAKGGERYFQIGNFKYLNTNLGLQALTVYNLFDDFHYF